MLSAAGATQTALRQANGRCASVRSRTDADVNNQIVMVNLDSDYFTSFRQNLTSLLFLTS